MDRKKLEHYYNRQKYLKSKIRGYQERRDSIARLSASYEGERVFNSKKIYDKEAEELAKLRDDLDKQVKQVILEGNKELIELNYYLDKLENEKYKTLLSKRYIEGKDLNEIAKDMNYDYYYICRLHGNALAEFDKLC